MERRHNYYLDRDNNAMYIDWDKSGTLYGVTLSLVLAMSGGIDEFINCHAELARKTPPHPERRPIDVFKLDKV